MCLSMENALGDKDYLNVLLTSSGCDKCNNKEWVLLKGTKKQHSHQMSQNIQTEKALEIQSARLTGVCGEVQSGENG